MNFRVNIVFLWAEVPGFLVSMLEELVLNFNVQIHLVHWDTKHANSTRYKIEASASIKCLARSEVSNNSIYQLLKVTKPKVIVVSGWMDKGYVAACKKYKKEEPTVRIVAGIDDQWLGTIRQKFGRIYYYFNYRKIFDYMWVAGKPQFSYAQHFGYSTERIISNLLSADTKLFQRSELFTRRFVFIGRFDPVKRLDLLIKAYCELPQDVQQKWPLCLIGDGEEKQKLLNGINPNVEVLPFLQPKELRDEMLKGGVGCLMSFKDQWGVSIHEYALMGYPLLLSSGCGAATEFLISGYNGYLFEKSCYISLSKALSRFTQLSDEQLILFSKRSTVLGQRITSELSAASLMSILYD